MVIFGLVQHYPKEIRCEPHMQLKNFNGHIIKGKKKEMELILIIYVFDPISKISFQHVINFKIINRLFYIFLVLSL